MEPTKVQVAGPNIRILLSSVRAQQCSTSVYKSAEANSSLDPTEGVQNHCVSRRHDVDGSVTPEADIPIADTPADTSVAGLQDKPEKVLPRTNTGDTISRTDSELGDHETGSSPRKSESTDQKMSTSTPTSVSISSRAIQGYRTDDSINTGCTSCTPTLPKLAEAEERGPKAHPVVRDSGSSGRSSQRGATVVVSASTGVEREANSDDGSGHGHRNLCIPSGLGGTLCGHPDRWTVVGRGAHDGYQLFGATRRSICSKSFLHVESKQRHPHSTQNGQYNSYIIHQQNGGNTFTYTCKDGMQPWCLGRGIVLSAEHLPGSQNVIADSESRTFHSSAEWQLHKTVFQNILTLLGQC